MKRECACTPVFMSVFVIGILITSVIIFSLEPYG